MCNIVTRLFSHESVTNLWRHEDRYVYTLITRQPDVPRAGLSFVHVAFNVIPVVDFSCEYLCMFWLNINFYETLKYIEESTNY